jgi:hypothetical protein
MPFFEIGKALSEYRQEHYTAAAEWAGKSVSSSRIDAQKHAYLSCIMPEHAAQTVSIH